MRAVYYGINGVGTPVTTTRTIKRGAVEFEVDLYPVNQADSPAVLVLPGGGFREHTDHDGAGYAHWLATLGIGAIVLRYKLRPDPFPLARQQTRAAFAALHAGDALPGVDPTRIGVIGSSAGGLLAGLLATGAVLSVEPEPPSTPRPRFHIQSYGLADLALLPPAAVAALLGDKVHLADELSPVAHIDSDTPPTFVWATALDGPGLPNALAWTRHLAEHEVPVETHIYPDGPHGVGLADGRAYGNHGCLAIPHTAQWTRACGSWLHRIAIL